MPGKVIFLNGASSSGKSTLANLIQAQLNEPFVLLSVDLFIESMQFPEGITDEVWLKKWPPLFHVAGFHAAIIAMWKYGLDIIVDHVIQEENWFEELKELIEHNQTVFVGIYCSLEELERRERIRNDREIGIAKYQYERVHKNKKYTVKVDTSELGQEDCAKEIISAINSYFDF
jgi:chloramphenicol 3-O phosphotransferase